MEATPSAALELHNQIRVSISISVTNWCYVYVLSSLSCDAYELLSALSSAFLQREASGPNQNIHLFLFLNVQTMKTCATFYLMPATWTFILLGSVHLSV